MPRSILPTRNMLTRDRLMTQNIGIASLCTCDNVASYVFSLFSFCSHGDRFRERLEWQHSPSGPEELWMIIPLTHLMWFYLNLSVLVTFFIILYFLKLKKIYITDFHLISMNNHCDKLCQVFQLTCHFALLLWAVDIFCNLFFPVAPSYR